MNLYCQICKEECFRFCTTCTAYLCNTHLCEHLVTLEGLYDYRSRENYTTDSTSGESFLSNREIIRTLETETLKQWEERYKGVLLEIKTELEIRRYSGIDIPYKRKSWSSGISFLSPKERNIYSRQINSKNSQPNKRLINKLSSLSSFNLAAVINSIKGDV